MTKLYIYKVNGTNIEDTTPFGEGWSQATALAIKEHTWITREVVNTRTGEVREEFFTNGCFLPMRSLAHHQAQIF